jgi:hypothetical protein
MVSGMALVGRDPSVNIGVRNTFLARYSSSFNYIHNFTVILGV